MDIKDLQHLAGIKNKFTGYTLYEPTVENISDAAADNVKKMKANNIRPGGEEWFKLWFGLPKMRGENMPAGFRGRKKK